MHPALATEQLVEQSKSFVFQDARVYTYNDDIAISYPSPVDIEGAVDGKTLFALLSKSKEKTLTLQVEGGEMLVKGKRTKAGLRLEAEIQLPLEELGTPKDWIELPDKFEKAVEFCQFSAGHDEDRPLLTCLLVEGQYVSSCDNVRLSRYDMGSEALDAPAFPKPILLPATASRQLLKYHAVKYALTAGWIHFRNEEKCQFSTRVISGDYPNITQILKVEGQPFTFADGVEDVLDRAGVFVEEEKSVMFRVSNKGQMLVRGEGVNGWFEEKFRVRYKDVAFQFQINPLVLIAILKHSREAVVGERKIKLEGENFTHVIGLIAPKVEEEGVPF